MKVSSKTAGEMWNHHRFHQVFQKASSTGHCFSKRKRSCTSDLHVQWMGLNYSSLSPPWKQTFSSSFNFCCIWFTSPNHHLGREKKLLWLTVQKATDGAVSVRVRPREVSLFSGFKATCLWWALSIPSKSSTQVCTNFKLKKQTPRSETFLDVCSSPIFLTNFEADGFSHKHQ